MDTIVVISTEKTGVANESLLNRVLEALGAQKPTEIVVVHNLIEKRSLPGVTNLHFPKTGKYEVASCINLALQYCEERYQEDFILIRLDDDCIPTPNYLHEISTGLGQGIVHQGSIRYEEWPARADFEKSFDAESWLHRTVPDLDTALLRIFYKRNQIQLFSLIAVIWNARLRGIRYDENYNGHWGLEDTDFSFQLLEAGCRIKARRGAGVWHFQTGWKKENHTGAHAERINNPNQRYFYSKWLRKYTGTLRR